MISVVRSSEMDNNKQYADVVNSCRICMGRSGTMKDIFNKESKELVDKVIFCTGVQITEVVGLPSHICCQCIQNLDVAYKLKSGCILANNMFYKLLFEAKIKEEHVVSDEYCESNIVDDIKIEIPGDLIKMEDDVSLRRSRTVTENKEVKSIELNVKDTMRKIRGPYKKDVAKKPRERLKVAQPLKCTACDIRFTTREEMNIHRKEAHCQRDTLICELCGKVVNHASSLVSHARTHGPALHACAHCDYRTANKQDLIKHIRIHTGSKIYQCEFCSKRFYTSSNLHSHTKRNHLPQLRRFRCHVCDKSFFDNSKLKRHLDSHSDIKRYECDMCHSRFTRRCYWKKHLEQQHNVVIPPQRPGRRRGLELRAGPPHNQFTPNLRMGQTVKVTINAK